MSTLEVKTVSAACAGRMLELGKAKTLQLVHSGRLPAKQLDGRIRVHLSDIDAFPLVVAQALDWRYMRGCNISTKRPLRVKLPQRRLKVKGK